VTATIGSPVRNPCVREKTVIAMYLASANSDLMSLAS
jgi:hypothetical protein